ncbi:MAG TPA: putative baseplate assembly protein [Armatimonadota bacterium]
MSAVDETPFGDCGCCEAGAAEADLANRPGLTALAYRIGTHGAFLRRMLDRLPLEPVPDGPNAGTRPLDALTARSTEDPAIALLDAWAVAADVLAFYNERILNENYLRTATERRSVLELARAIGYELSPGLAAEALLAFTVEDAPGAPGSAAVPVGTRVQSVPGPGELPQSFETVEEIDARAEWNALRPRRTQPARLAISDGALFALDSSGAMYEARRLYFRGTQTGLKAGDRLVASAGSGPARQAVAVSVLAVAPNAADNSTRVDLATGEPGVPPYFPLTLPDGTMPDDPLPFTEASVRASVLEKTWTEEGLQRFLAYNRWEADRLLDAAAAMRKPDEAVDQSVFALRERASFFGHNAPYFFSVLQPQTPSPSGPTVSLRSARPEAEAIDIARERINVIVTRATGDEAFPYPWDDPNGNPIWPVWKDPLTDAAWTGADVFLDRAIPSVTPGGWAAFEQGGVRDVYAVTGVVEMSRTGFAVSAKVTGLSLSTPAGAAISKPGAAHVRTTAVYVQSEALPLAGLPIAEDVAGDRVALDGMTLGLRVGQSILVSGERSDAPGVTAAEAAILKKIEHAGGITTLTLTGPLTHAYARETVSLSANVVRATHGETVKETLGSGDGARANQAFTLKKPPLTYVSASTASGAKSTLDIRVDEAQWTEAPSLLALGPRDQAYTVRINDDASATVVFGDGTHGARLPTGVENVRGVYRSGIGPAGEVAAGTLTMLLSRPLGIRGVTNPLPTANAAAPETLDRARQNAPLTVLTLDRIVSLRDYEDFARAFAGVGKALAVSLWDGENSLVHVTVASDDGDPIPRASDLYRNLVKAMNAARDPGPALDVADFQPHAFGLTASVLIDPRYIRANVYAAIQSALEVRFDFEARGFGQPVTEADVVAAIQAVEGVVAVRLEALVRDDGVAAAGGVLFAAMARRAAGGAVRPAELLMLDPFGVTLKEMSP